MERIVSLLFINLCIANPMIVVYEWKQLDYQFPTIGMRDMWLKTGQFQPINCFTMSADYSPQVPNKLIVTTPSFRNGVPSTLNIVVNGSYGNHVLRPYPSWEWHNSSCSGLISVLRTKVTDTGHLWVLDSGSDHYLDYFRRPCPPKLVVFDLQTDQEVWRYEIPEKLLKPNSFLATVEVEGNFSHAFAYLADCKGYAIIVVDKFRGESWKAEDQHMAPQPSAIHMNMDGVEFEFPTGVLSIVSSGTNLYFHSVASRQEAWIPISELNNQSNFHNTTNASRFVQLAPGERFGQSPPAVLARNRTIMLFSNLPENALYCWKLGTEYISKNHYQVFQDDTIFQFPTGLKVISEKDGREWLLAVTSRYQNVVTRKVKPGEVNYRILKAPVEDLIAGTPCAN